jgi:hypothetical protein
MAISKSDPLNMLKKFARALLHPFEHPDILPGQPLSRLDAQAERLGVPLVEGLFAESRVARRMAQSFARFLGDDGGARAVKKEYHALLEKRLRAVALHLDPAENHDLAPLPLGRLGHPLDHYAWTVLSKSREEPSREHEFRAGITNRLRHIISLFVWAAGFLSWSLSVLFRDGRAAVSPVKTNFATTDFWGNEFWAAFQDVVKENGDWDEGCFLLVRERGDTTMDDAPFPDVAPSDFRVPWMEWIEYSVAPAARLIVEVLMLALWGARDPRNIEVAIRVFAVAVMTLDARRIAYNVHSKWYVDIMDYSAYHCVKAAVFRKIGTRLIGWPYHQFDSPGSTLSYLDYSIFVAGGEYQSREYGASWNPETKNVAVGQLRNDRRVAYSKYLDPKITNKIQARINAGDRIAVLFADNDSPGWHAGGMSLYRTVLPYLVNCPGWFLVIKQKKPPKPNGVIEQIIADPKVGPLLSHHNVLLIPRESADEDVCPAAWLIEHMDLGVSLPGTIQWESLAKAKPHIAYFPANQDTAAVRGLKKDRLLLESTDDLRKRLSELVNDPDSCVIDLERIRKDFDVYADDQALSRIAKFLFAPNQSGDLGADSN